MADDGTHQQREAGDERDDQIGALLEVEPLDELTRRRLVAAALAAAAPPAAARSRRWLAAAAVLLVVVGGGGALLATSGGGSRRPTHRRARADPRPEGGASGHTGCPWGDGAVNRQPEAPQSDTESREAVPAPAAIGPPFDAGDFGDLTRRANVDRLRGAFRRDLLLGGHLRARRRARGHARDPEVCGEPSAGRRHLRRHRALRRPERNRRRHCDHEWSRDRGRDLPSVRGSIALSGPALGQYARGFAAHRPARMR